MGTLVQLLAAIWFGGWFIGPVLLTKDIEGSGKTLLVLLLWAIGWGSGIAFCLWVGNGGLDPFFERRRQRKIEKAAERDAKFSAKAVANQKPPSRLRVFVHEHRGLTLVYAVIAVILIGSSIRGVVRKAQEEKERNEFLERYQISSSSVSSSGRTSSSSSSNYSSSGSGTRSYSSSGSSSSSSARDSTSDVPYVGMSESQIDSTGLGKHVQDYIAREMKNGEFTYGRTYVFKQSGKSGKFYATCFNGRVTRVLNDLKTSCSVPSSSGKSSQSSAKDEYNAKSYSNSDDFYEDYWNDFADFDEAEQYYDEYGN